MLKMKMKVDRIIGCSPVSAIAVLIDDEQNERSAVLRFDKAQAFSRVQQLDMLFVQYEHDYADKLRLVSWYNLTQKKEVQEYERLKNKN